MAPSFTSHNTDVNGPSVKGDLLIRLSKPSSAPCYPHPRITVCYYEQFDGSLCQSATTPRSLQYHLDAKELTSLLRICSEKEFLSLTIRAMSYLEATTFFSSIIGLTTIQQLLRPLLSVGRRPACQPSVPFS